MARRRGLLNETIDMVDPRAAIARLTALRTLGVQFAVDDFGTGHSSLGYLRQLAATIVKPARPFVAHLDQGGDVALAKGITELAHAIGMTVVGEGVEREAQATILSGMGCELDQGYLFNRPLGELDLLARWTVSPRVGGGSLTRTFTASTGSRT